MRNLLLTLLAMAFLANPGFAQTNPYGEDLTIGDSKIAVNPTPVSGTAVEPVIPENPLASGTPEALVAESALQDLIAKFQAFVKSKNWKKSAEALAAINKAITDKKDKKGKILPGLLTQMKTGGIDASRISALEGRFASLKSQIYLEGSAAMVREGRNFEDFSTSKGPGGGDVSCAWLMSHVLRAAGLVPAGWNEEGALNLTTRLMKEFGWKKVPPNGRPNKGTVATKFMKAGDIVFWDPSDHVGVYLGNGMVMSNSSSGHKGTIHPVSGYYDGWVPRYVVRPTGG